jgi:solute carrier family 25 (peroxisomal adenine nucleotide transporter), member 17
MQGIVPTLVMVANPTIQYALYEWLTALWRRRRSARSSARPLGSAPIFLLSALAKLGATLATYPLLVVKNRVQVRACACACTPMATSVPRDAPAVF